MKTLLLLFCTILLVNIKGFSQNSINDFKPVKKEIVSSENPLYQNFINQSNILISNPELKEKKEIEMLSLVSLNSKIFQIPLALNKEYNYLVIFYNLEKNDFIYYFQFRESKNGTISSKVYDQNGTYLYLASADGEKFTMTFPVDTDNPTANIAGKSPFSKCMHRLEDMYEDTFSGWLIWNLEPGAQVVAAIHCQGCVNGWWKTCP